MPVGDAHQRAGGTAPEAAGESLRVWVTSGAAGHPHKALPHSSSAQPVPVLSQPQMGPGELQCSTQRGSRLENRAQGGKSWGLMEVASLTSVSPMTVFAFCQKVALGQRRLRVQSSLCWGVKRVVEGNFLQEHPSCKGDSEGREKGNKRQSKELQGPGHGPRVELIGKEVRSE